jgi:hypothetical protein
MRFFGNLRSKSPAATEVMKFALMVGLVLWVYLCHITPLFQNIYEAQQVLCGGVTNFVYAENSASTTIYAVRTSTEADWTQSEKDVLQMAAPTLNRDLWPNLDQSIFDLTLSNNTKAIISPSFHGQMRDAEVPSERKYFDLVKTMDSSSAMENADTLDCADYANAESRDVAIERLQAATNDPNITSCQDAIGYCEEYTHNTVRALCPLTCGCDTTVDMGSAAGFFGAPKFGCPAKCATKLVVTGEVEIAQGRDSFMPCSDWGRLQWEARPAAAQAYVFGLFEYLLGSDPEHYQRHLQTSLMHLESENYLDLADYNVRRADFITAMMDGTIRDTWSEFQWSLGLRVPHPRGLRGCEFLTSFEVTALLGINLCDVGDFRSLRSICATSCGCVAKPNAGYECPPSCNHPSTRTSSAEIPELNWVAPPSPAAPGGGSPAPPGPAGPR